MNKEKMNLAVMIGIYISIILMIVAITILVKNVKEIQSDPISYGIERNGFAVCSCYADDGRSFDYNASGQIPKKVYGWNYQFED